MVTARNYGWVLPIGAEESRESLVVWRRHILAEHGRAVGAGWVCLAVGLLIQGIVPVLCWLGYKLYSLRRGGPSDGQAMKVAIASAFICGFTLLIATFTKPAGRSELAERLLHEGLDVSGVSGTGPKGIAFVLLVVASLYGSFAIVEACTRYRIRRKLAGVNVFDAAWVLSEVSAAPTGVSADKLSRPGQCPQTLRRTIAYLLLDGWIDLHDRGRTVSLRSPSLRRLSNRHPLAAIFESPPDRSPD